MMSVTNSSGRSFFVCIVRQWERYGLEDALQHRGEEPLIEFYDATYANKKGFGPRGQFVSRYDAKAIATFPADLRLCLHGAVPDWQIDILALRPVVELARSLVECGVPS